MVVVFVSDQANFQVDLGDLEFWVFIFRKELSSWRIVDNKCSFQIEAYQRLTCQRL